MKKYVPKHQKHNKKHNKKLFKIKKFVINTITVIAFITMFICFSSVNSTEQFYIPLIIGVVCGVWLYLYCWANDYIY